MKTTPKLILIACITIVVVLVAAYLWGRSTAKKEIKVTALPAETDWGSELTPEQSQEIEKCAALLYEDMKGLNIFTRDITTYNMLNTMSDRLFVGTANYFKQKYCNEGESLLSWMEDENFAWISYELQGLTNGIKARLVELNAI